MSRLGRGLAVGLLWSLGATGTAHAKGCHDTSNIVGMTHCSRFGDGWDVSRGAPWLVELGSTVSYASFGHRSFDATVVRSEGEQGFTVPGSALGGGSWTGNFSLRVLSFPLGRVLYVGAEMDAGGGNLHSATLLPAEPGKPAQAAPASSPWAAHASDVGSFQLGSVVGISIPIWRFDLRAELLSGFRVFNADFDVDNQADACWTLGNGKSACPFVRTGDAQVSAHVEPRVGLSVRLSPWVTAGAMVGFEPTDNNALSFGGWLQFHTRAYDGFYPRKRGPE